MITNGIQYLCALQMKDVDSDLRVSWRSLTCEQVVLPKFFLASGALQLIFRKT